MTSSSPGIKRTRPAAWSWRGERALEVATAAKLARALWIVPLTFGIAFARTHAARAAGIAEEARGQRKHPWFIAGFSLVAALVTLVPQLR